jgi:GNAT superfamily N-acetyltransferase
MVPDEPPLGNLADPSTMRGGAVIRLEPMDEATFEAWRETSIAAYAQDKIDSGHWLASEALERSAREFAQLLPDGRSTSGHEIRSIVSDAGQGVGMTWFAPEDRPMGRVIFIYDISVEPAHRRKGHAQATLEAIESYAREHGCVALQLHVFGGNIGARELYQRAGYVETDVTMVKAVTG